MWLRLWLEPDWCAEGEEGESSPSEEEGESSPSEDYAQQRTLLAPAEHSTTKLVCFLL